MLHEAPTSQQEQRRSYTLNIQRENDDSISNQSIAYRRGNRNVVWGERDPIRGPQNIHHPPIDRYRGNNTSYQSTTINTNGRPTA